LDRVARLFSEGKSIGWMNEARAVADLGFHAVEGRAWISYFAEVGE